jgi:hypothetical protein
MIEYDSGVLGVIDVRWHSQVSRDEFRIRGTGGEVDMTVCRQNRIASI